MAYKVKLDKLKGRLGMVMKLESKTCEMRLCAFGLLSFLEER